MPGLKPGVCLLGNLMGGGDLSFFARCTVGVVLEPSTAIGGVSEMSRVPFHPAPLPSSPLLLAINIAMWLLIRFIDTTFTLS